MDAINRSIFVKQTWKKKNLYHLNGWVKTEKSFGLVMQSFIYSPGSIHNVTFLSVLLTVLLLLFTRRLFMLNYSDSNTAVFGWTLATKAYLYYDIITVHLHYILSNWFIFNFKHTNIVAVKIIINIPVFL